MRENYCQLNCHTSFRSTYCNAYDWLIRHPWKFNLLLPSSSLARICRKHSYHGSGIVAYHKLKVISYSARNWFFINHNSLLLYMKVTTMVCPFSKRSTCLTSKKCLRYAIDILYNSPLWFFLIALCFIGCKVISVIAKVTHCTSHASKHHKDADFKSAYWCIDRQMTLDSANTNKYAFISICYAWTSNDTSFNCDGISYNLWVSGYSSQTHWAATYKTMESSW